MGAGTGMGYHTIAKRRQDGKVISTAATKRRRQTAYAGMQEMHGMDMTMKKGRRRDNERMGEKKRKGQLRVSKRWLEQSENEGACRVREAGEKHRDGERW